MTIRVELTLDEYSALLSLLAYETATLDRLSFAFRDEADKLEFLNNRLQFVNSIIGKLNRYKQLQSLKDKEVQDGFHQRD